MPTNAENTNSSLVCQENNGKQVQPSEPAAVAPSSTPGERPSSEVMVKILCCMMQRLLFNTPSEDVVAISLMPTPKLLRNLGVTQDEWDFVENTVTETYKKERRKNPFSGMF